MYKFLLVFVAWVMLEQCLVQADVYLECEDADDDTFVASWESCDSYVYCNGDESEIGKCDPGQYFDSELGSCDAAENVKCFLESEPSEESEDADKTEEGDEDEEEEQSEEGDGEDEEDEDEEETPVKLPTTVAATPPTLESNVTQVEILNVAPLVKPNCPFTDDPNQVVLMANNDSCTGYYLCYHGHAMEMNCDNALHFNAKTGQCDRPESAQCALERPNAYKCLSHMSDFFPHADNCNYFYYCIKGFLTLQQCPFYYGWDIERRSCVQMNVAKCYPNARRT